MTRTSGYTENELLKMQEDAINRVKMMQDIAKRTVGDVHEEPEAVQPEVIEPSAAPGGPQRRERAAQSLLPGLGNLGSLFSASGNSPISSLLNWAGGDRTIIMVLMVILLGDNGDQTLLLALCYLLLFD